MQNRPILLRSHLTFLDDCEPREREQMSHILTAGPAATKLFCSNLAVSSPSPGAATR